MLKDLYPQRKRTRLNREAYADVDAICSITISTLGRSPIFRNEAFATACVDLLVSQVARTRMKLYAYCFMPDHLHLLIGPSVEESIIDFVREFKGKSTRMSWQHGLDGKIWQQGFYDRFLRRDEHIEPAARYILGNPVRKGMVDDWEKYPFCGTLVYDL